jgi:hypothetical protein
MKTSAVCCIRNRNNILMQTLHSWLQQTKPFDEIVLVQWGGKEQIQDIVNDIDTRIPIAVYEVLDADRWILTHAYNLAISLSKYPAIYKLDADYMLHPSFTTQYQIDYRPRFFAGNWRMYPSCNQNTRNINGCVVINQQLFWNVGGYNEHIVDYGYDDNDLYERLQAAGYLRLNISYGLIQHIPHDDTIRACKHSNLRGQMIQQNQKIAHSQRWSKINQCSRWCVKHVSNNHYIVRKVINGN